MWVYLIDKLVPEAEAKVSVFDQGFLYGDGLFETFRAYSGKIFALSLHLDRLAAAAKRIHIPIPPLPQLAKQLEETLRRNDLNDAILRLTLTRGLSISGLRPDLCETPTLVITARPFTGYDDLYAIGVSVTISTIRRVSSLVGEPCMKSLNFMDNVLARLEAHRAEVFETLFLNSEGFLAEGSISNLFWIKNGEVKTPALTTPILNGITREVLISEIKKQAIPIEEGLFPLADLLNADEAFLTNTAFEVMPLIAVEGKKVGSGQPGEMTNRCRQIFIQAVKTIKA